MSKAITTPTVSHRNPIELAVAYVALATLLCLAVASPALSGAISADAAGSIVPLAQLTPFLAALVLFSLLKPGGFANTFALRWVRAGRGTLVGIATVVVIGAVQLAVSLGSGAQLQPPDRVVAAASAVVVLFALQILFAMGEELGWRGWLVTQLRAKPFWVMSIVSAAAWTAWHIPALPLIVGDGG